MDNLWIVGDVFCGFMMFYDSFSMFFMVCLVKMVHCPCGSRGVMFLSRPTSGTRPSRGIATRRHTMYLMYAAKISVKLDTSGAKDAIIKKIQDPIRRGRKSHVGMDQYL
jgi:hypothetical protein